MLPNLVMLLIRFMLNNLANKGQHIVGQHMHVESTQVVPLIDSTQVVPLINGSKQNNQVVTTNRDTCAWICVLTVSNCKSAKLGQTNVIGSIYKVGISIHGIPTRALIDSGSQVWFSEINHIT